MIKIRDKTQCCGCSACYNICPKNAISMKEDEFGFQYPVVLNDICINCGLCERVCCYLNEYTDKNILDKSIAYGGWINDNHIRSISTSGGIFTAISEFIINSKGIVCGAIYDEELEVIHAIVDNMDDLKKINGSKYVQSNIKNNYRLIKSYLDDDRYVLFSGTPCQVSGLNSYLGKEYDKLYTCDIVCHGVPSPLVFRKYKKELEETNNSKIIKINFRDKKTGWENYSFSCKFKNGKEVSDKYNLNPYMKAYLADIDLRESCPTCKFSKLPRYSDFTLGDFWGVDNYYPNLNTNDKGTSLVLVHTIKGDKLIKNINNIYIEKCELDKAIEGNPSIIYHLPAHEKREEFFEGIKDRSIYKLNKIYIKDVSLFKKYIDKIKRFIHI